MKYWSDWQTTLSFVFLMGIQVITRFQSTQMTNAKPSLHVHVEHMLIVECLFRLCNALASFQKCMMSIFSDMIEEIMKVFIDDFFVYGKLLMVVLKI
jgi:hypothetical protein